MFKKILVALDHSTMGDTVFQAAIALAQAHGSELMLLHVLTSEEEGSPVPIPAGADGMYWTAGSEFNLETWRKQWEAYETSCLETLRSLTAEAQQAKISTDYRQISGTAGRVICALASDWKADVIVIGHRGHSGLKELFLGSVSNYVMHHAYCNVFTIKAE